MDVSSGPSRLRFGGFEADLQSGELRKGGFKVRLQEQPFRVLALLLQRAGSVVTREELRRQLWPGDSFGDFDHGLNNAINRLREALGDSAESPRFIETLPRHGYRFVAPVETLQSVAAAAPPIPVPAGSVSPAGRRFGFRGLGMAAVAAAVVVVVVAVTRRAPVFRGPPSTRRAMLAVLPFENVGADPQQEYFSDGLTEEMIGVLGRLQPARLGVIARTSAMQYKHTRKRVDEIGRELAVDYVLEGSVRRGGDRVRIVAQLVHVADQAQVWSQEYERDLKDVLDVQGEVARAIAVQVKLQLTPSEQARLSGARPLDPLAHELYLKGRYQLSKRSEDGFRKGLELFQQAIDASPTYAPAHAGLADSYLLLGAGAYSVLPPRDAMPRAKAAARRALELDETLAAPHTSLAFISYVYEWDWPGADRAFRRAVALDPNYATSHHWYSLYLKSMGRRQEALAESDRARELDPLSLIIANDRAWALFHLRDYDQAIAECRRVLAVDPSFAVAHWNLGLAQVQKGEYEQGIEHLREATRLAGERPVYVAAIGHAYAVAGRQAEARALLSELEVRSKQRYVSPGDLARVHVGLGQKDEAFRLLEQAYAERSDLFVNLKVDPRLDPLRSDPRFASLMQRVGLASDPTPAPAR